MFNEDLKEDIFRDKAKENQRLSEGKGCQKSDKVKPIDVKKEVAKIAKVSHDTNKVFNEDLLNSFEVRRCQVCSKEFLTSKNSLKTYCCLKCRFYAGNQRRKT